MKIAGISGNGTASPGPKPTAFGQTVALQGGNGADRFENGAKPSGTSGMNLGFGTLGSAIMMALALVFGDPMASQAQQAEILPLPFEQPDAEAAAQMEQLTHVLGLANKPSVTVEDYRDAFFKLYLKGFGKTMLDLKAENPALPISAENYALTFEEAFFKPFARQFGLRADSQNEQEQMSFFRLLEWTLPKALDVRNSAEINDMAQGRIREKLDMGKDLMEWWMLASLVLENPEMTDSKLRELFDLPEGASGIFPPRPEPRPKVGSGSGVQPFRIQPFLYEEPRFQEL